MDLDVVRHHLTKQHDTCYLDQYISVSSLRFILSRWLGYIWDLSIWIEDMYLDNWNCSISLKAAFYVCHNAVLSMVILKYHIITFGFKVSNEQWNSNAGISWIHVLVIQKAGFGCQELNEKAKSKLMRQNLACKTWQQHKFLTSLDSIIRI